MREKLNRTLHHLLTDFQFRRFYLPDGKARLEHRFKLQPYERLLFVLDGVKEEPMSLNGKIETVRLFPGDYYLVRKHVWEYTSFSTKHEFFCLVPREGYLRIVHYHVSGDPALDGKCPPSDWYHTPSLSESLRHAFDALARLEQPAEPVLTEELARLILRLSLLEMQKEIPHAGKAMMTFESIRDFVEVHFSEPVTREGIARYLGINPCYLSQLFRTYTGGTFQDYLRKCRLEKAKHLLAQTSLPVKTVAGECGWNDDVYFIRQFRESTGLSPGKYRIAHLKK